MVHNITVYYQVYYRVINHYTYHPSIIGLFSSDIFYHIKDTIFKLKFRFYSVESNDSIFHSVIKCIDRTHNLYRFVCIFMTAIVNLKYRGSRSH